MADWLPHACSIAPLFLPFLLPGASISVLGDLQKELSILLLAVSLWNGFFLLEWHSVSSCFDFFHACVIGKLLAASSANYYAPNWPS